MHLCCIHVARAKPGDKILHIIMNSIWVKYTLESVPAYKIITSTVEHFLHTSLL